ncbi:helix-turn-helix domain-containing protein [Massilia consociata]|uniref:Helix-turn-helix domain-containing protein n=1 Tax=Massilia consociata TaxID=760117 RepID=A0ABV6FIX5_9BURK
MRNVILPDARLARYVRMFMVGRFDGGLVHLPASADIQLLIYLDGGASMHDARGGCAALPDSFVAGATMQPRLYAVSPGSTFFGIVFRPGGFRACFGIPADLLAGQLVALDALLPGSVVHRWRTRCHDARGTTELLQAAAWLLTAMAPASRPVPPMPVLPLGALLQPVPGLAARLGVSPRQFERRFLADYGIALRDFRRLARFSCSLARLMSHSTRCRPVLADIAADAHYSDQAHFTRDFQQFVGATPGHYLLRRAAEDSIYRLWQFDRDTLDAYTDLA